MQMQYRALLLYVFKRNTFYQYLFVYVNVKNFTPATSMEL
jgi:hypothetical protein